MKNLRIHFSHPLLLLIFLLGAGITALLYFRLSKKYRKNRNRITSIVLHLVVLALAVLTLAGTIFTYQVPNKDNQIILLVDVSDTEAQSREARDKFVRTVVDMGQYDGFSIGIVTFGFDQVYAVELTNRVSVNQMMAQYQSAALPDTSATNIAAALNYAASLFYKPETAKIVLVTDGKETDEEANSVIRTIAAKGISVDIANITSAYEGNDMQLLGATLPDYHLTPGANCQLSVTLNANTESYVDVTLYDNGEQVGQQTIRTARGAQNVTFQYVFTNYGLHRITFELSTQDDLLPANNVYHTYINLENYNNLLILEHKDGESAKLASLLTSEEGGYQVTVKNIKTVTDLPKTLNELRNYDQIILNNIANSDLPEGYDDLLYRYVRECGGGLFTVGGADIVNPSALNDADKYLAHSYNYNDMVNSLYQSILPVQTVRSYTPPVAVMVIVDRSGSMSAADEATGSTAYNMALSGARSCLNALSERDYFGLMTLDSEYETLLPMTQCSQDYKIQKAISKARELGTTGGTVFPGAIERASRALLSLNVARRHVIIVTDGQVPSDQEKEYLDYIKQYHKNNGITYSVVGIGVAEGSDVAKNMQKACDAGGGRLYALTNMQDTIKKMREDLNAPAIKEINFETFYPNTSNTLSSLFTGIEFSVSDDERRTNRMTASLNGYFGVKVKSGAELILMGDYDSPLYAQWKFGKGTVGSFMCDLNGMWSSDFLSKTDKNKGSGRQFILNVVSTLLPTESIRENEITVSFKQNNYTNQLSIFTSLAEGEQIIGQLKSMSNPDMAPISMNAVTTPAEGMMLSDLPFYITTAMDTSNNYSRCKFVIKSGGVYEVLLQKVNAEGTVLAEYRTYQSFAYSEEYVVEQEVTVTDLTAALTTLAEYGNGKLIANNNDPIEVFDSFVTAIEKTFDPRYVFMIVALVLFLADIAVRKFKFKWPHELIRAHREKKKKKEGGEA